MVGVGGAEVAVAWRVAVGWGVDDAAGDEVAAALWQAVAASKTSKPNIADVVFTILTYCLRMARLPDFTPATGKAVVSELREPVENTT